MEGKPSHPFDSATVRFTSVPKVVLLFADRISEDEYIDQFFSSLNGVMKIIQNGVYRHALTYNDLQHCSWFSFLFVLSSPPEEQTCRRILKKRKRVSKS